MTPTDSENTGHERHGHTVRGAYADLGLSPEQRERHKRLMSEAARHRDRSRFPSVPAEIVAIATAALLLVAGFAIWQSLDPQSEEPAAGVGATGAEAVATERQRAMPFSAPETCPAGAWAGPEDRLDGLVEHDGWTYSYSLDGSGISLSTRLGLLYQGGNAVFWLTSAYQPQDTVYSAERLDGESPPATFQFAERSKINGENDAATLTVQRGTITFPAPGCWQITVDAQDASLRHTVYVYPTEEGADAQSRSDWQR